MNINVLKEIESERKKQDKQWGGPAHDDQHNAFDWVHFISKQLDELQKYAGLLRNESDEMGIDMYTDDFKERLVKIASLSVAALESIDRKGSAK